MFIIGFLNSLLYSALSLIGLYFYFILLICSVRGLSQMLVILGCPFILRVRQYKVDWKPWVRGVYLLMIYREVIWRDATFSLGALKFMVSYLGLFDFFLGKNPLLLWGGDSSLARGILEAGKRKGSGNYILWNFSSFILLSAPCPHLLPSSYICCLKSGAFGFGFSRESFREVVVVELC